MTTTNPFAVSEASLGLPSAAELAALANAYFPDLTAGINAPTGTTVSDAAVNPGVNGAVIPGAEAPAATAPGIAATEGFVPVIPEEPGDPYVPVDAYITPIPTEVPQVLAPASAEASAVPTFQLCGSRYSHNVLRTEGSVKDRGREIRPQDRCAHITFRRHSQPG